MHPFAFSYLGKIRANKHRQIKSKARRAPLVGYLLLLLLCWASWRKNEQNTAHKLEP
jgi:hypothetical protein